MSTSTPSRLCEVPGCGKPHNAKGRCATHYGHIRRDRPRPPEGQRPRDIGCAPRSYLLRLPYDVAQAFDRAWRRSGLSQALWLERAVRAALEADARHPPRPEVLAGALQDRLETPQGPARTARTVRTPRGPP